MKELLSQMILIIQINKNYISQIFQVTTKLKIYYPYANNMAQCKVVIYLLIIIKRILGLCNFLQKRKQKKYWIN